MDLHEYCPKKIKSAEEAVSKIKRGSRVFVGTGCGEPQHLIKAMVNDTGLQDIMVYQMLSFTLANYVDDPSFLRRFSLKLFCDRVLYSIDSNSSAEFNFLNNIS